jgi:hypothetical protein
MTTDTAATTDTDAPIDRHAISKVNHHVEGVVWTLTVGLWLLPINSVPASYREAYRALCDQALALLEVGGLYVESGEPEPTIAVDDVSDAPEAPRS